MNSCTEKKYLFVGTYTSNGSKGIYVYEFDDKNGKAQLITNTEGVSNPSYLAIAPDKQHIYAVNEDGGKEGGGVSSFLFDSKKEKIFFINKQKTGGDNPCYVSIDATGRWAVAGNYSGGNFSVLPIAIDGSLQPAAQIIQHKGSSVNKQRQEKAHVHATVFSPEENFLFTTDLGMDKIIGYPFNPLNTKPIAEKSSFSIASEPGSGPRHFIFHPNKKWAYLVEELSGTVVMYHYTSGKLSPVQRISSHPKDFKGEIGSADIHTSPDGKFLYVSNRGDANNIAIFSVDEDSGQLTNIGFQSSNGIKPRNFLIDPSGKFLLVANQDSNNIVIFKRDKKSGMLEATGEEIKVPNPVCLKMLED